MLMEHGKLTSINPLMTHGNELRGEIKLLNKARQVKTCNRDSQRDQLHQLKQCCCEHTQKKKWK